MSAFNLACQAPAIGAVWSPAAEHQGHSASGCWDGRLRRAAATVATVAMAPGTLNGLGLEDELLCRPIEDRTPRAALLRRAPQFCSRTPWQMANWQGPQRQAGAERCLTFALHRRGPQTRGPLAFDLRGPWAPAPAEIAGQIPLGRGNPDQPGSRCVSAARFWPDWAPVA